MADTREAFSAFVASRQAELVRLGWALTGDRHLGEDLAQAALQQVWPRWQRITATGDPYAYTQRALINEWNSWLRRRRWRAERLVDAPPERVDGDATASVDDHDSLTRWLSALTARQRAVIVLRFVLDLSVTETAQRIGCSDGTVKSQTSKALRRLRASRADPRVRTEEATP